MVQMLAAVGELQRDLQRGLTYDGLRAAEAKGNKGGRRTAISAGKTDTVRTAYPNDRSITALAREHGVSCGAIRTAVADLKPEHTVTHQDTPAPELPVTLDMPGKVADFLRTAELDPAERAALDQGVTVRHGQGYSLRVTAAPAVHSSHAASSWTAPREPRLSRRSAGPARVREPRQRPPGYSGIMINLSANHGSIDPRGRAGSRTGCFLPSSRPASTSPVDTRRHAVRGRRRQLLGPTPKPPRRVLTTRSANASGSAPTSSPRKVS
ncbi:hypothetical protein [Streptomyces acidicola]|uniref:hypothetical protein n=1 Tax=Streptomyces acidicola TaxID=2596892 RepID=UPI00382F3774